MLRCRESTSRLTLTFAGIFKGSPADAVRAESPSCLEFHTRTAIERIRKSCLSDREWFHWHHRDFHRGIHRPTGEDVFESLPRIPGQTVAVRMLRLRRQHSPDITI